MNILYISKLTGNLWAGPNNSVPAQVEAQSKIDNVFWYNLNNVKRQEWVDKGLPIYNLVDIPSGRLRDLPSPFNKPDIVIVEEVYCHTFSRIIYDIQKADIPYIVIPRSTLTKQAQKHHHWKKLIGNFIYYNNMLKKAAAIQYLTQNELEESGSRWNKTSFIIPNGIEMPCKSKTNFNTNHIVATYIGRLEVYQKGLDLLLEAINYAKKELREINFKLNIYGPDQENGKLKIENLINEYNINDLVSVNDSVVGLEKERVLLDSDIFIMTSRFEGFSVGLIEALSYGIPCIVSIGTNLADKISKIGAGWKCECNAKSIKETLIESLQNKNLLCLYSQSAINLSLQYNWSSIALSSKKMYEKVLRKNKKIMW